MAVISALTMSVFCPSELQLRSLKRTQKGTAAERTYDCTYELYKNLAWRQQLQKQNRESVTDLRFKTRMKKLAHLVSYLSRMESILHKEM